VDGSAHDLGLVYLSSPIQLSHYPAIAHAPLAMGRKVVNIGRVRSGAVSRAAIFVGAPLAIQDGAQYGCPYDYAANEVLEHGDSGGPVLAPDDAAHVVYAVNSGHGEVDSDASPKVVIEVLARVDLLYTWLAHRIGLPEDAGSTVDASPPPEA